MDKMKAVQTKDVLIIGAVAGVIFLLAALPVIISFGGRFILTDDFFEQQLPFFMHNRRMLATGVPFWDWHMHLGADFVSSYSFYTLGSPFFWLLMPFPAQAMPYLMIVSIVLKHMVAAAASFVYISVFTRRNAAMLGALLYTFSSFTLGNSHFNHFTDVIALFPLLLIGFEHFFGREKKKRGLFAVAVFLNVMVNYYFFVGSALFFLLYVTVRFLYDKELRRQITRGNVLRFVFEGMLGVLMSAVILLPSAAALVGSPRLSAGLSGFIDVGGRWFFGGVLESVRMWLMPVESARYWVYTPLVYRLSSVAAYLPVFGFLFVLYYCFANKKNWLKTLIIILCTVSLVPFLNAVFVLWTDVGYRRWWYALVLMSALATAVVYDEYGGKVWDAVTRKKMNGLFWLCAGVAAVIIAVQSIPYLLLRFNSIPIPRLGGWLNIIRPYYENPVWRASGIRLFSVIVGVSAFALLYLLINNVTVRKHAIYVVSVFTVIYFGAYFTFNNAVEIGWQINGEPKPLTLAYRVGCVFRENKPYTPSMYVTYRIDHPPPVHNYSLYINRPSLTSFNSLRGTSVMFMEAAGFGNRFHVSSVAPLDVPELRVLLSVKYYFRYDVEPPYFDAPEGFVLIDDSGDVAVWGNTRFLPFGFAYEYAVLEADAALNRHNIGRIMLNAVVLENAAQMERLAHVLQPAADYHLALPIDEAHHNRAALTTTGFVGDPSGFTASVTADSDAFIFFSVPYHRNWRAYVNGEPVIIERVNIAFMGVVVEEGGNYIVFRYRPVELFAGAAVSGVAGIIFLIYMWIGRLRRFNQL